MSDPLRFLGRLIACGAVAAFCLAHARADPTTSARMRTEHGQSIVELQADDTTVRIAPQQGANTFSIVCHGIEFVLQPEKLEAIAGVRCGVPILYPTPNRVRQATFVFAGKEYRFPPNAGPHFIHGLVCHSPWEVAGVGTDALSAWVECVADFREGTDLFRQFPFPHLLRLRISVRSRTVRWTYTVDNRQGTSSVPFGFALHPYFLYQGTREQTYLTIPATHWMEAERQLPTGRLIPADELDYPLGQPLRLSEHVLDDVFFGLTPDRPVTIEFRDVNRGITIRHSPEFTHLVVWTPDRPFFGVESQTCSTDAHNLHSRGMEEAAHLQICPPGETMSGWVEYELDVP
ncbi:MAG: hypothetical protein KatS3mg111_2953 [Pirellulaceae bacterium]|nr:MAG: hypothetical protein KatS3mg111_2953 [Pirellulaceae bacterium]